MTILSHDELTLENHQLRDELDGKHRSLATAERVIGKQQIELQVRQDSMSTLRAERNVMEAAITTAITRLQDQPPFSALTGLTILLQGALNPCSTP